MTEAKLPQQPLESQEILTPEPLHAAFVDDDPAIRMMIQNSLKNMALIYIYQNQSGLHRCVSYRIP